MLHLLDAIVQHGGGVAGEDGDAALLKDVAGIDLRGDEVDGASRFRIAGIESILHGVSALVLRQQGRVYIDDAAGVMADHRLLQDAHEAREHDDIGSCTFEMLEDLLLRGLAELFGVRAGIDEVCGQSRLLRDGEEAGVFLIRNGRHDLRVEFSGRDGLDDGFEIRAHAAAEHGDAQPVGAAAINHVPREMITEAAGDPEPSAELDEAARAMCLRALEVRRAYQRLPMEAPWTHWNDRCYRTIKGLYGRDIKIERRGTHHHALADAEAQAVHLLRMLDCDNEQRPYESFFAPSGECA